MNSKNKFHKLLKKALNKYRFVIMTDDSFEEKVSLKISRLKVFLLCCVVFVFVFFVSALSISKITWFGKYFTGGVYQEELQQKVVDLSLRSDSLIDFLGKQEQYLKNIKNIINDDIVTSNDGLISDSLMVVSDLSFQKSLEDSLLRLSVESEEKGGVFKNQKNKSDVILFFPPIKGVVTDGFNYKTKHFGIDLVAKEKTRVASVFFGTVVISDWNSETGYVIGIQHKNGYLSIYKHNSILLKSVGDFVSAGEHIAVIGDSGEFSSGPHLHFELWYNGAPLNPEDYIVF